MAKVSEEARIREVGPDELSADERHAVLQASWIWSGGRAGIKPGSFMEALLNAATRADLQNRAKIRRMWPTQGWAMELVQTFGVPGWARSREDA